MSDERRYFEIGGMHVYDANEEAERVMRGRDAFVESYCAARGWNREELSLEQILEIRKCDGWKSPVSAKVV